MLPSYRIIDISQPVQSNTACFPGDTPFQKTVTVSYADSRVINLTAMTMSPHVGTHADAPIHIHGDMGTDNDTIGNAPLSPYIGPCRVLDISHWSEAITLAQVRSRLEALPAIPERLLFKTARLIRYDVFEEQYAHFAPDLVEYLARHRVRLMGVDTPSVDHIHSKTLETHHAMHKAGMSWLENLDLTRVDEGDYFLIAPPLKFMELEASPLRAVLLAFD